MAAFCHLVQNSFKADPCQQQPLQQLIDGQAELQEDMDAEDPALVDGENEDGGNVIAGWSGTAPSRFLADRQMMRHTAIPAGSLLAEFMTAVSATGLNAEGLLLYDCTFI